MNSENFFILAIILFMIGLAGVSSRRNLFVIYLGIELMLSAVNLLLATISRATQQGSGSVIALLIFALIAAEAALFLAMLVQLYRSKRTLDSGRFTHLAQEEKYRDAA